MKNMQRIAILVLFFLLGEANAQGVRYLDEVFDSVVVLSNISYGNALNASNQPQNLKLDIYMPYNDTASRRPLIIWMHGGSFISGSKDSPEIVPFAMRFAKRGYVCASIEYRLGLDSFPPNQSIVLRSAIRATQDGKAAVRFFRANASTYNLDTTHIFFGGSSAGAITALNIGYLSSLAEFQMEADSSLIINLGGMEGGNDGSPGYSSKVHGVINLCGAIGDKLWIQPGDIPVASVHGDQDATVPYKTDEIKFQNLPLGVIVDGSFVIDSFANAIGVQSALKTFYGQGHVPYVNSTTYMDSTINFLAPHVYSWLGLPLNKAKQTSWNLLAYPNPAHHWLYLQTEQPVFNTLRILDYKGQIVYETQMKGTKCQIPVYDLPKGLYILQAQTTDLSYQSIKFIKE